MSLNRARKKSRQSKHTLKTEDIPTQVPNLCIIHCKATHTTFIEMSKRSSALAALDDDEAYAPESVARSAPRPAKAPRKSAVKASTSTSKTTTTFAPSPVSPLLAYTPEDLADLPFYEVIEHFIELQSAYRRLESEKTSATASGSGSGATRSSMDEKEVEAMAKVFAKVMQSGITSQMKWQ